MALLSGLLWPTECATVGLSGGYTETHNSVLSQQGRQVTLSELEAQTILFL